MTRKLTPSQAFSLTDRPDLEALVDDARAAFLADSGYTQTLAQRAAVVLEKRGELPSRRLVE